MSGGGTAGHIYPALALANKLSADGNEVIFAGTEAGLESRLVRSAGYSFTALKASGFNRSRPLTLLTSSMQILGSTFRALKFLRKNKVDVVVGFGGYVSIPVGLAALILRIPLALHEQNSVPGMANKFLARGAKLIMLSFEVGRKFFPSRKKQEIIFTGNPVRQSMLKLDRESSREKLVLNDEQILVFVFGGSRGSRMLNTAILKLAPTLLEDERIHIIHATGEALFHESFELAQALRLDVAGPDFTKFMKQIYDEDRTRYLMLPYIEDMGSILAATDLAVCRAGATTLAELSALSIAAILVPYPYATDDHQTINAKVFVSENAARMIPDNEVETPAFEKLINELLKDKSKRDRLGRRMREAGRLDAVDEMARGIYSIAGNSKKR